MARLQAAVARIVRHEAAEAARTRSTLQQKLVGPPFTSLRARRSLRAITSEMSRLVTEAANDLVGSGGLAERNAKRGKQT